MVQAKINRDLSCQRPHVGERCTYRLSLPEAFATQRVCLSNGGGR